MMLQRKSEREREREREIFRLVHNFVGFSLLKGISKLKLAG